MRIALVLLLLAAPLHAQMETLRDTLADGTVIVGDVHAGPEGRQGPVILMFHQGGGNARGEYRTIAPRLVAAGFSVITFDIRGGGDRFDATNRVPTADAFRYCDARADVDAALALARSAAFDGPLILWGSSYSATLVLHAAAHTPVTAVLAFSPAGGDPMDGCQPIEPALALARRGTPLLVVRPLREARLDHVAAQLEEFRGAGIATFVAPEGAHGSSILDPTRSDADVTPQWTAVLEFLDAALSPAR